MADFTQTTAYSLAEFSQWYEEDGKLSNMINLLKQDNMILDHMMFKAGNQTDGYKGKLVTSLPTVYFRRLYQGVTPSKAGIASVKEPTRQLAARWGVDVDEIALYEGTSEQNAFRLQQGMLFIEAMKQKVVEQLFYGNPNTDADELRGLAAHYPTATSPNVVDAGGSGSDNTSIWGIVWGDMTFHGFFPKNMKAGLQHEDLGKYDAEDADGKKYRALGDEWKWNLGFFLADWRAVVRICNIDVSDLSITDVTSGSYVNLRTLTITAKNKIPAGMRGRMKWYVSEAVMTALEIQAGNHTGNVHLRYGEWQDSKEVLFLHGKPVFEADAILETEAAI